MYASSVSAQPCSELCCVARIYYFLSFVVRSIHMSLVLEVVIGQSDETRWLWTDDSVCCAGKPFRVNVVLFPGERG